MASLISKAFVQALDRTEVRGASDRIGREISAVAKREAKAKPVAVFGGDTTAFSRKAPARVLTEVESVHDTTWNNAPYTNVETVNTGRPLSPKAAMDYIMAGTATGQDGLAHDFHADTAEAAQHPGGDPNHIHAEGALLNMGLPIPGSFGGIMDGYRTGPATMHINMVDKKLGFALQADIKIEKGMGLNQLIVTEEGVSEGDLPGEGSAIALGHLKFFDAGARVAQGTNEAAGLGALGAGAPATIVGFGQAIEESAADGLVSTGGKLFLVGTLLDTTLVGAAAGVPLQMAGATIAATASTFKLMSKLGGWASDQVRAALGRG